MSFPAVAALPFVLLLAAIAILPMAAPFFWKRPRNRAIVVATLTAPTVALLLAQAPGALFHALGEYASFIVLLGALFTISGGIVVRGDLRATPGVNAAFLAAGAVLANLVGTTGASMLLIRPLLRSNRQRARTAHIPVFFILIVSNAGGLLTPLGDPPLFLGFLRGVPFFWTLRLFPIWLVANLWLLALFLAWDAAAYRREMKASLREDAASIEPLHLLGYRSMAPLGAVIGAVFLPAPLREAVMILAAAFSYFATPPKYHRHNRFLFEPMSEVALLFAGIFVTMVPALALVGRHAAGFGISEPWQFFWATGLVSSALDNAPTYLTFLTMAQGLDFPPLPGAVLGVPEAVLAAIAAGSVLMGANTYIGNGPNFLVKAIAEHDGTPMPSFFGFALRAGAAMLPLYLLLTLVWFR